MKAWRRFLGGRIRHARPVAILAHAVVAAIAYLGAVVVTSGSQGDEQLPVLILRTLPILLIIRLSAYQVFHLYDAVWAYLSIGDLIAILKATTMASLLAAVPIALLVPAEMAARIVIIDWIFCSTLIAGARLALRITAERHATQVAEQDDTPRRALIVGAGAGAAALLRELHQNPRLPYDVLGLVDDDRSKQQRRIHGVRVLGLVQDVPRLVREEAIEEILIAIPSGTQPERQKVIATCLESGVPLRTVPTLAEILEGRRLGELRDIDPIDLLGRAPIRADYGLLAQQIAGRRILVTGAGGSIGSELCRQITRLRPDLLILYERAETSLNSISLELGDEYPDVKTAAIVGDIRDAAKVDEVIAGYAPDVIYHAAAYKHVHLMEAHPLEAIENNIIATQMLAETAARRRVSAFVLISTDKAVNPIGVMGMTKRVAEDVVRTFDGGGTVFISVRFGNVLGSAGSVLPMFREQISKRRSLTITDPNATRYFMLTSEAVYLVMQAGRIGQNGETFFLEMGSPVRIMEFAERLIRLSGLMPEVDVPVDVVGLRSGERLNEELVHASERLLPTEQDHVFLIEKPRLDRVEFARDLALLRKFVHARDETRALSQLRDMVGFAS